MSLEIQNSVTDFKVGTINSVCLDVRRTRLVNRMFCPFAVENTNNTFSHIIVLV